MRSVYSTLINAAVLWAAFSFPLSAQQGAAGCPEYEGLATRLREFGEDRIGIGIDVHRRPLELWVRPDGRTWTIIIRLHDGTACVADYGAGWQPTPGEGA